MVNSLIRSRYIFKQSPGRFVPAKLKQQVRVFAKEVHSAPQKVDYVDFLAYIY